MEVREVLQKKGNEIYHISPDATVFEAIKIMADYRVGALLVMDGKELQGIISERDYRNKVILQGKTSKETPVHEIMTRDIKTVAPNTSVEECMNVMTDYRIRHLPVKEQDQVVGVISIGDTVKTIIDKQKEEIRDLRGYISGDYPG